MIGPVIRVPGAIDAELGGYIHQPEDNSNYGGGQGRQVENDIPEDFRIGGYFAYNVEESPFGGKWTEDLYGFRNGFWITIPPGAKYLFFQVVGAWMLSESGYCKVTIDKDSDGDALPDSWERDGVDFNKDGTIDLTLPDADFERKDLYVEIDYMAAGGTCPGHKPDIGAITDVQLAFAMAPGDSVKNPDGSNGINLHIDTVDWDGIVHREFFQLWSDFQELKKDLFGTEAERQSNNAKWTLIAKRYTHRYCMFIHQYLKEEGGILVPTTSGGVAEGIGCNDFLLSLGGWASNPGTRDDQAVIFMHELGHALGLYHGGGDNSNYKPNYLSIMNYLFEYDSDPVGGRPLDYSRVKFDTLDERALDELKGLGVNQVTSYGRSWYQTAYMWLDVSTLRMNITLLMPIDWDGNGEIEQDVYESSINNFQQWGYDGSGYQELEGFNDWENLNFYFQDSKFFAASAEPQVLDDELTWELAQKIKEAWNQFDALPIPEPDPSDLPSEPEDDETSKDILPIIGVVAVVVAVILLIVFLFVRRRKKITEKP
jgi:hypothetical protein